MVTGDTRTHNSIYDEMKSRAFELHMMERQSAYETYTADDELNDALKISEDDYNFNLSKSDDLATLSKMRESLRRRFVEQKLYIEQMDISEKNKIEVILTSACILRNFGTSLINRNTANEELYLLACAMVNVEPSSYSHYENIILYHFNELVKMLESIGRLKPNHIKLYVKAENN